MWSLVKTSRSSSTGALNGLALRACFLAGVQALDAAVCVLYKRSKTDPVRVVGNRTSRLRTAVAFEDFCGPSVVLFLIFRLVVFVEEKTTTGWAVVITSGCVGVSPPVMDGGKDMLQPTSC